jgi:hypothetical protein
MTETNCDQFTGSPLAKQASNDAHAVAKDIESGNNKAALKDVHDALNQMSPDDRRNYLYYLNKDVNQDVNKDLEDKGFPPSSDFFNVSEYTPGSIKSQCNDGMMGPPKFVPDPPDGSTNLRLEDNGKNGFSTSEAKYDVNGQLTNYHEQTTQVDSKLGAILEGIRPGRAL